MCLKAANEVPNHVLELCKAEILIGDIKEHVQELWINYYLELGVYWAYFRVFINFLIALGIF